MILSPASFEDSFANWGELSAALAQVVLVATDMDGTLTQDGKFTASLLASLAQLAAVEIPVVIVTGRSAGWVQGIAAYLPVAGAIAENGGLFFQRGDDTPQLLVPIAAIADHRQQLATLFHQIQHHFPQVQESADNRFRLTDWTFDVAGLADAELDAIADLCAAAGWGFTYSTVQCHLRPASQDKGPGLAAVVQRYFADAPLSQVLTVGDSPNDAGLFDPARFPLSVGVANVRHYRDRLPHFPRWVTPSPEAGGFEDLVATLVASRSRDRHPAAT